jgi:uncharacterized repeat protein (TIGR01451 family)
LAASHRVALGFEANTGQTDAQVQFFARGRGYTLFLTPQEAVFALHPSALEPQPQPASQSSPAVVRLHLLNASTTPAVEANELLPGGINYYLGNDPAHWQLNVPRYGKIRYREVYPGIDVIYHGAQGQLEYDFHIAAKADPQQIRLAFANVNTITLDEYGDLLIHTPAGVLRQRRPEAYQEVNGARRRVAVRYAILSGESGEQQVALKLGRYDRTKPLIIDPVLIYSSYLGGPTSPFGVAEARTFADAVAADASGALYIAGQTNAVDFPKQHTVPPANAGAHVFVSKFVPNGNGSNDLVWTTILSGSIDPDALQEYPTAIAVNSAGVHIVGRTFSSDFPTTLNAFQPGSSASGNSNGFISRLDGSNGQLTYSTYLSGASSAVVNAIAFDTQGNMVVAGFAIGDGFPTTVDAILQTSPNAANRHAFVTVFNGANLLYSTLFGGTGGETAHGVAVSTDGRIHVVGDTTSDGLATTGAYQTVKGSGPAGFYAVIDRTIPGAAGLRYATYLSSGATEAHALAFDGDGNTVIVGLTESGTFPVTPGAFPSTLTPRVGAFLTIMDPAGGGTADLKYATVLDRGDPQSMAIDAAGRVWLAGRASTGFPAVCGPLHGNADAFIAVMNPAGSSFADRLFTIVFGGSVNNESANGVIVDLGGLDGLAAVVGHTFSADFPTTMGSVQPAIPAGFTGGLGFVSLLDLAQLTPTTTTLIASPTIIVPGQPVTLTATVTGGNSGTVYFQEGATVLGSAPLVNGTATLDNVVFSTATPSAIAIYSGDCTAATSQGALNGNKTATSMQLLSNANPSFTGQSVTFTAALTASGPQIPTGTVRFEDNGVPLATVNINAQGNAVFTTSTLTLGTHPLSAIYDGNATFLGSSASLSQRVTQPVDLSIIKTVSPTVGQVGQALTYTLQVSNTSPNAATGVVVRDILPNNLTVNSVPASCTQAGNVITCPLGNLAANSTLSLTVTATPTAPGVFTNTATIGGNEADPAGGNNQSSVTTTVDAVDLAVTLNDAPDPVGVGGTLTYTIGVTNNGPSTANNVTLTFTRDASLTVVSFNSSGLSGLSCAGQTTVTCSLASLASGTNGTITLNFTTTAVGSISATASISSPHPETNTANNTASTTTTVARAADLSIAITDSPDPAAVNGTMTYTITVRNLGPATDAGVNVSGTLSGAATFIPGSVAGLPGGSPCVMAATTFSCQGGKLVAGDTAVLTLQAKPTAEGTVTLSGSISGEEGDPNQSNNTANESTTVTNIADLALAMEVVGPTVVNVGQLSGFLVRVSNGGPSPAVGISVTDTVPAALFINGASSRSGPCGVNGQVVTCTITQLQPNEVAEIDIGVTPQTGGTFVNSAVVISSTQDSNQGNNSASTQLRVPSADLSATLFRSAPLQVVASVYNSGPDEVPARDMTMTITFPGGLRPTVNVPLAFCGITGQVVSCRKLASLPPNENYSLAIDVTPVGPVTGDIVMTTSSSLFDPNLNNNTATLFLFPGCASDVPSGLTITRSGYRYFRTLGRYVQQVTITNASGFPIAGPVSFVLDGLGSNVAVISDGGTICTAPTGTPYRTLDVGTDNVLSPGESATVTLQFIDPSNTAINYTTRVLSGANP